MTGLPEHTEFAIIIFTAIGLFVLFILTGRLIGWALGISDIRANQRKILSELRAINIHLSSDSENNKGLIEK